MKKFEQIIQSHENGQKTQCFNQFDQLTPPEKEQFTDWIMERYHAPTVADVFYTLIRRMI